MREDGEDGGIPDPVAGPARADAPALGVDAPADEGPASGAEIVRLSQIDPRNPARVLGDLRAYWSSLRRGRAIPDRSDVEPRGLRDVLAHAFILERIAPGAGRLRLAGRHLLDLMGMEVRGMPLCAFFNPSSRGRLSDVLETVFAGPQIAEFEMCSETGYRRPRLTARMLVLPLRSDLGDVTRALGAIVATSEIGLPPRRFDLVGEVLSPVIEGARTLEPSASGPAFGGFAEPPPPWSPGRRAPPRLPAPPAAGPPPDSAAARRAAFRVIEGDG